jgi:short-subunit dehydrogenase
MPINFKRMPIFTQHPDDVARTGLNALGRKATVVSGLLNKFYAWENRFLPRTFPVALFGFLIRRAYKKEAAIKPVTCSEGTL